MPQYMYEDLSFNEHWTKQHCCMRCSSGCCSQSRSTSSYSHNDLAATAKFWQRCCKN